MLYQAYQAHADIMGPVRKFAGIAARAVGVKSQRRGKSDCFKQSYRRL